VFSTNAYSAPAQKIFTQQESMQRDQYEHEEQPHACPLCESRVGSRARGPRIAGGRIFVCRECAGFFLHPSRTVSYEDSDWTAMRKEHWARDVARGHLHAGRIRDWFFRKEGAPLRSVLELGCGSGFLGMGLRGIGVEYTGIDVDGASVRFAQDGGLEIHQLGIEDLPSSPLAQRRFDLVVSSNAFEHVSSPVRSFQALRTATKGVAVVVVPNPEGLLPRAKANPFFLRIVQTVRGSDRIIAYSIDGYCHNIAYSRRAISYFCRRSGLRVESLHSIGINDPVFGFVQPNEARLYRMVSRVGSLLDMDSQLLLVAR